MPSCPGSFAIWKSSLSHFSRNITSSRRPFWIVKPPASTDRIVRRVRKLTSTFRSRHLLTRHLKAFLESHATCRLTLVGYSSPWNEGGGGKMTFSELAECWRCLLTPRDPAGSPCWSRWLYIRVLFPELRISRKGSLTQPFFCSSHPSKGTSGLRQKYTQLSAPFPCPFT